MVDSLADPNDTLAQPVIPTSHALPDECSAIDNISADDHNLEPEPGSHHPEGSQLEASDPSDHHHEGQRLGPRLLSGRVVVQLLAWQA